MVPWRCERGTTFTTVMMVPRASQPATRANVILSVLMRQASVQRVCFYATQTLPALAAPDASPLNVVSAPF